MLELFSKFLSEIGGNKQIRVNKNTLQEEIELGQYRNMERSLRRANKILKLELPEIDFEKFIKLGSLILDWDISNTDDKNDYLWGGYQIHGFASALGSPSHFWDTYNSGNRAFKNNPNPKDEAIYEEFLPKLNYFHKSGHGDDGTFGCFLREEGVYPCPIYFYDSGIWFPMNMSLDEYYESMMKCNAVYYWQYFYIDTDLIVEKLGNYKPIYEEYGAQYATGPCPFLDLYKEGTLVTSAEGVLHQMKIIIKRFPKIFPSYDVNFFQERHNALEEAISKL
ncbi:hypothetical protein ABW636_22380 [Aquimarina sp. 2201CG1-2-11]|uniref:hypothetical protein n=1 Tax=Aquimarina discodermiae TaxID=3231043 RepID=UPI0034632D13